MNDYKSLFDNMSDKEFENLLDEYGFKWEKAEPGKGGILYKGKLYQSIEEYDKVIKEEFSKFCIRNNKDNI